MKSMIRIRYLAQVNPSTPVFDKIPADELITFMPLETVWADARCDKQRSRPKSEISTGYVRFQAGDILSPKVTPTFQAGRSALITDIPHAAGAASTEVHVLRVTPSVADPRYVRYGLLSKPFLDEGVGRFQGVAGLQRVPEEFVRDFELASHPVKEQRRIADFLDEQIALIDNIIAARGAQVARVAEHSVAVMAAAALPPGNLRVALRRLVESETLGAWGGEPGSGDVDVFCARVADFRRGVFELGDVYTRRSIDRRSLVKRKLQTGDVLLERSGGSPKNPVGCAVVVRTMKESMICSNFVSRIRPAEGFSSEYLGAVLAALYSTGQQSPHSTQTTGIQNLDTDSYLSLQVPHLTVEQQSVAAASAWAAVERAETARQLAARFTAGMEELKRALISSAVSNEFDVSAADGSGVSV